MRVLPKYFPAVWPSTAVRRLVLPSLLACVFTLHWAAAQAPASAPGAPSGLAAAAGNRSIALTWDDPNDASITGYQFRVHADREPDWREWKSIPGSTHEMTGHTLASLTNGVVYGVQVRAYNDAGAGEPAETSAEPQMPAAFLPGAPNGLTATPGDRTILLAWDDPSDASITGYQFRVHADREPDWREWKSIPGSTRETTDHRLDLTNGVRYRVQVRARNAAGVGASAETSAEPQAPAAEPAEDTAADAPVAAEPPGAPNGLMATPGDGTIALTWDDPNDLYITGYQFRVHADRESDWREWKSIPGSTRETTDYRLDLTNGVRYRVQVRARNSAGAGEPSETSAEPQAPAAEPAEDTAADAPVAAAPPGAPNGLMATPGDGTIALTWDDPSDLSITGYQFRVHADRESDWREWRSISGSTRETTDHRLGLTNGVLYRVQVRARNSAGAGEPSEASAAPQAPDGGASSSASVGAGTDAPEDGGEEPQSADGGASSSSGVGDGTDAPEDGSEEPQSADGSVPSSDDAGESPRSGVPWVVIVVLAVCLAIGITIVAVRLRATSRGGAES